MEKDNRIIARTHQIFEEARKILGLSYMIKHWKKSGRQIYSWGANPKSCKVNYANPLEKIKSMLLEIKKKGHEDIVLSALKLLITPLGYEILPILSPKLSSPKSIKRSLGKLLFSIAEMLGHLSQYYDQKEIKDEAIPDISAFTDKLKTDLTELQIMLDNFK